MALHCSTARCHTPSKPTGRLRDAVAMETNTVDPRILLIARRSLDFETIRAALATNGGAFSVEWVRHLAAGITRLNAGQIDAVLLDLHLPEGLKAIEPLLRVALDVPILVVCDPGDELLAM